MPKIVDHRKRRDEIVKAFLRMVARNGYEGVTSRALADELGIALGGLWYYFDNFDAVITAAADRIVRNTAIRIERATEGLSGWALLLATLEELLPLREETRDEAHVIVGFWGRAATRPLVTRRFGQESWWNEQLAVAVGQAVHDGDLVAETPVDDLVLLLSSLTYGQQVYEVMHVGEHTEAAHRLAVDTALRPWRPPG